MHIADLFAKNKQYGEFCHMIFGTVKEQNALHKTKHTMFNTEQVPAESLAVKNYNWDTAATSAAAFYQNVTATKCPTGIENIAVENKVVKGIYDMQGRKLGAIILPGIYIVDGKKVLVK